MRTRLYENSEAALSCRTKAAPLGECGGALGLEVIVLGKASVLIGIVVSGLAVLNKVAEVCLLGRRVGCFWLVPSAKLP